MTNDEIFNLAKDYKEKKIFTSMQVEDQGILCQIFMPLLFISKEEGSKMFKYIAFMYEYFTAHSGKQINGYPTFMSARWLNKKDYPQFVKYYNLLINNEKKLKEKIL